MNRELLTSYGLKWNPFAPDLPVDSLMATAAVDSFCLRIERHLVRHGGFALIAGEPGTGKSVALRLLDHLLEEAGNPALMTAGLGDTLVTHAAGNSRALTVMTDAVLDEKLFIGTLGEAPPSRRARR